MRAVVLIALVALLTPLGGFGAIIIDNTTLGFYNSGLGDLSLDSVLGVQTDASTGFNLFPAANVSAGDPLIPPVASEPNLAGADPGTVAALGGFLSNPASLGGSWSGLQAIPTTWAVNSETAIVYEINAGAGLTNMTIDLGVDNGIFVWLDGVYLFGALAPGVATLGEYSINVGNLSGGTHYLQILREDHGGATGYGISVEADREVIPEPGTLSLFGFGGLALLLMRRRSASRKDR